MKAEKVRGWIIKSANVILSASLDAFLKLRIMNNLTELKTLLYQESQQIRKKLPLIGILLALLTAGIVVCWGSLVVLEVFVVHGVFAARWIVALGVAVLINFILVLGVIKIIFNVFNGLQFSGTRQYLSQKVKSKAVDRG